MAAMKNFQVHIVIERERGGRLDSSMFRRVVKAKTKREAYTQFIADVAEHAEQMLGEFDEMPFRANARQQNIPLPLDIE